MPVRFQRGSERMFRSVFPILAIFTILVSSSACVAAGARIEGIWRITAISFPGKMEFYRTGGIWAGRINFGPGQPWDELTNIYFDPQSGEIQFTRPRNNQWYTGILTGNRFTGTLTEGERTYNWEAARDVPLDLRRIQGAWLITAIGIPGKMEFYRTGGIWAGRINFGPGQPWDELTNIYFDPQSGEIQFTRPRNNQWYTGILTGNRFTGTLTEGERTYNWEARRDVPLDLRRIQGAWLITAIGFPGKMEFYRTGGIWAGRINFGPGQPWDELTNIYFDPQSGEIQFTRPRNNQWYTGILTGNRFTGTLTEGERTYNWEARRP